MSINLQDLSVVVWCDEVNKHKCGYCKSLKGSISNGMWADSLTVTEYQILIDRGWRRSGKYCYKPIMEETCCPQYTIKCEARNINLTKSQKKLIKKFNKYLKDGILNKKDIPPEAYMETSEIESNFLKHSPNFSVNKNDVELCKLSNMKEHLSQGMGEPCHTLIDKELKQIKSDIREGHSSQDQTFNIKNSHKEGVGVDHSKVPCKKAKLMRIERKKEKLNKLGLTLEKREPIQNQKSIEQFLDDIAENPKIKFRQCLIPTSQPNDEWESVKEIEYELYKKYQMAVHNDPAEKLSMSGFYRFLVDSPLEITLERMTRSSESFLVSAKLFEKYQILIHNEPLDECDEDQFKSFLVDSPLQSQDFPNSDSPGFGSFHQQYWLNDKLVAVGVIDILPKCVSSVYFFYDPDYRSLTLGSYGSLREIQLVRSLQKKIANLENYYMGFYIHSCPKMRYKGNLVPSYLLCPETYCWVSIKKCVPLLDENKYCRLNEDIDAVDENVPTAKDLATVKIVYKRRLMSFKDFKNVYQDNGSELFNKIGTLVGKKCISKHLCVQDMEGHYNMGISEMVIQYRAIDLEPP